MATASRNSTGPRQHAALERLGLDERTLIIWTSDNGAVRHNPRQGSNAPYKGWGYDTSEGAMRMPCVMRWPGRVSFRCGLRGIGHLDGPPAHARPTCGSRTAARPDDRRQGHLGADVRSASAKSPHDETGFYYYRMDQLQAVRSGPWKLYLPLENRIHREQSQDCASKAGTLRFEA